MNTLAWDRSSSSTSWSFSGLALNACSLISFKWSTQACLRGVFCLLCPQEVTVSKERQGVAEDSGSDAEPLLISEIVFQERLLDFHLLFLVRIPFQGEYHFSLSAWGNLLKLLCFSKLLKWKMHTMRCWKNMFGFLFRSNGPDRPPWCW